MKASILLLIFLGTYNYSAAQQTIVSEATGYITSGNYPRAEVYLDSILKKHPRNVDALMMKGNVLLNYAWQHASLYYFNLEKAESVFDTSFINSASYVPVIQRDTELLIATIWKKCLELDSTRNDISKGLCNLYSISLDTMALKEQLWHMKDFISSKEDNAYIFAEYARNIKARGQFEAALDIYATIAAIFPNLAGIRCDMAGEYFYNGRPKEVLRYVDSTLSKKEIDQTTFINSAAFYSMLGYYDKALETFQRYSIQDTLLEGDFYNCLMLFARMDTNLLQALNHFIEHASDQNYYDEVLLARRLLPYASNSFKIEDYLAITANNSIPDYYKVLIYQRGMRQFNLTCEPFMQYGIFQCGQKNFSIAEQYLEEIENCTPYKSDTEDWMLAYAYTLFMQGERQKAMTHFGLLLGSNDNFRQQAALYFTVKILKEEGKAEEAEIFLRKLTEAKMKTKYGQLCHMLTGQVNR
jgi:tetratricopeptide (TPR) repeat protein